jgi:hypothetical protein
MDAYPTAEGELLRAHGCQNTVRASVLCGICSDAATLSEEVFSPAGAERSSALQRVILALLMPTPKRHFAPGDLQFLTSRTYRRAKLFESDRIAGLESCLWAGELRSAPACEIVVQSASVRGW